MLLRLQGESKELFTQIGLTSLGHRAITRLGFRHDAALQNEHLIDSSIYPAFGIRRKIFQYRSGVFPDSI